MPLSAADVLRYGKAYIYTALVRDVVDLQPITPAPAPSADIWEIRARQAEMHVQALERRAIAAERRAAEAEQRVQVQLKELGSTPRPGREQYEVQVSRSDHSSNHQKAPKSPASSRSLLLKRAAIAAGPALLGSAGAGTVSSEAASGEG